MKLRNKKTGEIGDIAQTSADCIIVYYPIVDGVATNPQKRAIYNSLAELNEEWEDCKEPEVIYYISWDGVILHSADKTGWQNAKQIGNYFETEEEAEKAVEKLKAWKRLKDKGFEFTGFIGTVGFIEIAATVPDDSIDFENDKLYEDHRADLELLFSGEDD